MENDVPEISKTNDLPIHKTHMFQKYAHIFLHCLKYSGILKSINKGPPGLKNQEIMEMLGFRPANNKTKILLDQN